MKIQSIFIIIVLFFSGTILANDPPIELGKVNWIRDFDKGIAQAKKVEKPVFILFQEVPGCSTCQNYGKKVLSHPLIVDAIENLFVPVAIFNNKKGADAQVLKYYGEPSWNNPVVRIVNEQKKDIVKRVGSNYTSLGLVQAMVQALDAVNKQVPDYLSLLEKELLAEHSGTVTTNLAMYCFWTGEKQIGKMDGVVATQPGFMGGREVVQVTYDPAVLEYEQLLENAKKNNCASHVYVAEEQEEKQAKKIVGTTNISKVSTFRLDKDPKYYLSKTHYQYVPMTDLQAVKVNSLIGENRSPDAVLSPRQLVVAQYIKQHPKGKWKSAINKDIISAWEAIEAVMD